MEPTLCYFISSILACFTSIANFVPASFVLANLSSHTSWCICCRWLCWHEVLFKIHQVKFSFLYLHTTVLCMCAGGVSFHLTHHCSSKCSLLYGWWCESSSYLLLTHHHPHVSSHLTHPYSAYSIVMTSFICTKPPTSNSWCISCY